jgi:hypothetical protein|tara:strand:- start:319 stop:576 length:258 start_codon:yes stop_codon:yes gene_type:complete
MKYIQTDNLTIIDYGDGSGKLQIYNKTKSSYGWSPRNLITSDFGKPLKEITYNYVQKQVDKVYSTFNYDEIHKLITKLNNNDKNS